MAPIYKRYAGRVFFNFRKSVQNVYEMVRACSPNGEKRNAYRILMGNPEGK
jgi:hypothetical protein